MEKQPIFDSLNTTPVYKGSLSPMGGQPRARFLQVGGAECPQGTPCLGDLGEGPGPVPELIKARLTRRQGRSALMWELWESPR